MLSRVAESMYWMARNLERVETLARLIEVTITRSMDRGTAARERVARAIETLYAVAGLPVPENAVASDAAARIAFGPERLSLQGCIRIARQNALGVRPELTSELWQSINGLFLYLEAQSPSAIVDGNASIFLRNVRDAAQTFGGLCDATLIRDDGWEFLTIGRYLERAAMTARILRSHLPRGDWQRILEACCASEPFARSGRTGNDAADAFAFLVLHRTFPRSMRFCVHEVDRALHRLSGAQWGTYSNDAERRSGSVAAELDYTDAASVVREGPQGFAARIAVRLDELAEAIAAAAFPRIPVA